MTINPYIMTKRILSKKIGEFQRAGVPEEVVSQCKRMRHSWRPRAVITTQNLVASHVAMQFDNAVRSINNKTRCVSYRIASSVVLISD